MSPEPSQSRWPMPLVSPSAGMRTRPRAIVARPIGRLTKKIQCQDSAWVSTPPASSPSEPPATAANTYALIARGGTEARDEPGGDQRALAGGEPAGQRGGREQRHAGEEHAPATEQVAEAAG